MSDNRSDEVIRLLRSIDASLKAMRWQQPGAAGVDVADDRDLDGKYGDPKVTFKPRDWTGADMKGRRFSECPAEFLDLLAGSLDYFAKKADEAGETASNGKPVAPYKRRDAARARGWAKRIRAGYRVDTSTGELHEPVSDLSDGDPFEQSEWDSEADPGF